jgi:hypothetical protein
MNDKDIELYERLTTDGLFEAYARLVDSGGLMGAWAWAENKTTLELGVRAGIYVTLLEAKQRNEQKEQDNGGE